MRIIERTLRCTNTAWCSGARAAYRRGADSSLYTYFSYGREAKRSFAESFFAYFFLEKSR